MVALNWGIMADLNIPESFHIAKLCKVRSKEGFGLSTGTASHAIGTAAAMEKGDFCGAFFSLGLT